MTEQLMTKPLIIALTGSIAMGKSTAADMFRDAGIAVFDADKAVHILQGPRLERPLSKYPVSESARDEYADSFAGAAVDAIESAFPNTTDSMGVDRKKLSQHVLGDDAALKKLESIIHPMVAKMRQDFVDSNAHDDILIFDIPLLFEKGGEKNVDKVIVVSAPADVQRKRALARPNMSAEKLDHILSIQTPDAQKRAKADYIIDSSKGMDNMRDQIKKIIKNLRQSLA